MTRRKAFLRTSKLVANFGNDQRGAVALSVGLLLLVILGASGLAVDVGRSYQEKSALQIAADTAAVAAARQRFFDTSTAKMQAEANRVFAANYNGKFTGLTPTMIPGDGIVTVEVSGNLPTTILNAVGINTLEINTQSIARVPAAIDAEITFVLDYSSSMDSAGKYQTMRDAAKQLVQDLNNNRRSADQVLKFSLVPFASYVYADLPKKFLVGQDPTDNGLLETCVDGQDYPYNTQGATPDPTVDATRWVNMAPASGTNPCDEFTSRDLKVLPLTDNTSTVLDQLDAMTPHHLTNISLGLTMGWHIATKAEPFTQATPATDTITKKFIILLSDGRQTMPGKGPGGANTVAAAEDNLEATCTAIKADGISMVTVAFDLRDTATEDRLRNCASDIGLYFDAASNSDLTQSFREITEKLADSLRILN